MRTSDWSSDVCSSDLPAAPCTCGPVFVGHEAECAPKIGLNEEAADFRGGAGRQIDLAIARKGGVGIAVRRNQLRHQRVHEEAAPGELDSEACDIGEAHAAVAGQGSDPGTGCRRHDGPQDTGRYGPAIVPYEGPASGVRKG